MVFDIKSFGLSSTFSLIIVGILIDIALLTRIKFGDKLVTHLSKRPYYAALALMITMFLEVIFD